MENCTVRAGFVCSNLAVGSTSGRVALYKAGFTPRFTFSVITKLILFSTTHYK